MSEDAERVKRVLATAEAFNEAVSDAKRAGLIVEFHAPRPYGSRVNHEVVVSSVYRSLYASARPIEGDDF